MVVPYLTPLPDAAGQRGHALRKVFNGLGTVIGTRRAVALDAGRPAALGRGPAVVSVMPASRDARAKMGRLAQAVKMPTGQSVSLAHVDQGCTGPKAADIAEAPGIGQP